MKRKSLCLMCGPSGSGKSTWVRKQVSEAKYEAVHISRDEVRFSMVREDEEYFSRENEVFDEFCRRAEEAIQGSPEVIFVDATHLSEKSRNQVLDRLTLDNVDLYAVSFELPLDICLSQNSQRTGRARVPESVIRRMWYQYQPPGENEKYKYHILTVSPKEV